ncbi:MAG: hypothetical protein ABSD03_09625 [Vulcanimicrobiaceae bacterium]|jgi:hypothetical protein
MGRRYRPQKPRGGGPDDPMAWYLKDRARTDAWIDADVARSCTSKQQYTSEADAHSHALMNGMGSVLFSYECRYCGFWHLTRRPT